MEKVITITEEISGHRSNDGYGLEVGQELVTSSTGCRGVLKPAPPEGEVGEYFCDGNRWVWVPAV